MVLMFSIFQTQGVSFTELQMDFRRLIGCNFSRSNNNASDIMVIGHNID